MHIISYVPIIWSTIMFTVLFMHLQNARRRTRKSIRRKLSLTMFLRKSILGCPLCFRGMGMMPRNNGISDCKSRRSHAYTWITNASHYSTEYVKTCLIRIPTGACDMFLLTTATILRNWGSYRCVWTSLGPLICCANATKIRAKVTTSKD